MSYETLETDSLAKRLRDQDIYLSVEDQEDRAKIIKKLRGWDIRQEKKENGDPVVKLPSTSIRLKASILRQDWNRPISTDITGEATKKIEGVWYQFINAIHVFPENGIDLPLENISTPESNEDASEYSFGGLVFRPEQKYENWTVEKIKAKLRDEGIEFDKSCLRQNLVDEYVPRLKDLDRRNFNKIFQNRQRAQGRQREENEDDSPSKKRLKSSGNEGIEGKASNKVDEGEEQED
ncbi:hypothetical protein B7463_g1849, partial [Scytalidium lignicola]